MFFRFIIEQEPVRPLYQTRLSRYAEHVHLAILPTAHTVESDHHFRMGLTFATRREPGGN